MRRKRAVWISFDLGVRGDYEGMYEWLDAHEALECGDSVAFLLYEFEGDLIDSLSKEINEAVQVNKKSRVYVVWQDRETCSIKGRFIVGRRRGSPWAGYAESTDQGGSDSESSDDDILP